MLTLIAHFDLNLRYIFFTPMQRQCEIRKFAPRTNKMTSPARKLTYSPSSGPGQEEKGYQLQQDCGGRRGPGPALAGWPDPSHIRGVYYKSTILTIEATTHLSKMPQKKGVLRYVTEPAAVWTHPDQWKRRPPSLGCIKQPRCLRADQPQGTARGTAGLLLVTRW